VPIASFRLGLLGTLLPQQPLTQLPEEQLHGAVVPGKPLNGTGLGGVSWEMAEASNPNILTVFCAGWVLLSDERPEGILLVSPAET